MVSIIKVLRILLAGWSFRLSEGKGQSAKGTNGKRGPSAVGFFAFACTPALRFFCAWI